MKFVVAAAVAAFAVGILVGVNSTSNDAPSNSAVDDTNSLCPGCKFKPTLTITSAYFFRFRSNSSIMFSRSIRLNLERPFPAAHHRFHRSVRFNPVHIHGIRTDHEIHMREAVVAAHLGKLFVR